MESLEHQETMVHKASMVLQNKLKGQILVILAEFAHQDQ
jgi:hypothetical protein